MDVEQDMCEMAIQDQDDHKIVLIILTYNQREKTLQCLDHFHKTHTLPVKVVVWDNGSQDGTEEVILKEYPEILFHHHPLNLGVASGRNVAARLAIEVYHPTHLLFLDNDIQVEPGFVEALYEPFSGNNRLGQTQAKLLFQYDRERLNDGGGCQINFNSLVVSMKPFPLLAQKTWIFRSGCRMQVTLPSMFPRLSLIMK
jgi:GT2 family glycosyltransferase